MILIDSSVWIDYLRGVETRQTDRLHGLLGVEPLAIGDLILTEVLQCTTSERDFQQVLRLMSSLDMVQLGGVEVATQAARNFRALREKGVTVRKTIDCIIATRCIMDHLTLLHADRDFVRSLRTSACARCSSTFEAMRVRLLRSSFPLSRRCRQWSRHSSSFRMLARAGFDSRSSVKSGAAIHQRCHDIGPFQRRSRKIPTAESARQSRHRATGAEESPGSTGYGAR